jgi:hypothetical protein
MSIALLSNVWETPETSHRLAFGINKDSKQPVGSYVKNLRDRLTHAYQLATEASRNAQVVKRKDTISKSEVLQDRKACRLSPFCIVSPLTLMS